jgi:hypothetical protein
MTWFPLNFPMATYLPELGYTYRDIYRGRLPSAAAPFPGQEQG